MKARLSLLTFILLSMVGCTDIFKHVQEHEESTKEKVTYVCPMHPQITSDKPGSCSICNMNLVPVDNEEDYSTHDHDKKTSEVNPESMKSRARRHEKEGGKESQGMMPSGRATVKLSLDKQQLIGVTSKKVTKAVLFKSVRAPGRIAFDPELYNAQSEYIEALRQWRKVQSSPLAEVKRSTNEMIKSAKIRLKVMGLNSEQIKKLAKRKNVSEGLIVGAGKGENLIYADVFEADLSNIQKGQSVLIEGSFLRGEKLKGEVIAVDQVIDPKTRTGKVRIKIEKTNAQIRPEAFVNVSISVPLGTHLAIPLESVLDTGREFFVFVKKEEGRFEPRKITKIFETDESMAILKGLEEGEIVVTSANFMLDSESRLKAVIKSAGKKIGHNH